jgi:exodeoxyribonuclease VII large subunit
MPGIVTVDELTGYISLLFERSEFLSFLQVKGTLSGFKRHSSGHVYFTLLGDESRISCALFRSDAARVPMWPREGDEVLVEGRAGVYGPRGAYQVYAKAIRPLREAARTRAKRELMNRLQAEGLFDPSIKRKLPQYPLKVAVVTSPTGAALRDVVKVSKGRFPQCGLTVVPAVVQGAIAVDEIVRGLERAGSLHGVDAVMLVRGGGNRDDLNPFDEEEVVRAVRKCPVPVITGLGHQVDRTLSDLAADMDAPTPSAAAEALLPDMQDLLRTVANSASRMTGLTERILLRSGSSLEGLTNSLGNSFERSVIQPARAALDRMALKAVNSIEREAALAMASLEKAASSLDALSPLKVLSRGFTSCTRPDGTLVADSSSLTPGEIICILFRDGRAETLVQAVKPF